MRKRKLDFWETSMRASHSLRVVSSPEASRLLSVVERLTYTQICLLAVLSRQAAGQFVLLNKAHRKLPSYRIDTANLLQQIYELSHLGLVIQLGESGGSNEHLLGWFDVAPAQLRCSDFGQRLATLLNVDEVDEGDINEIKDLLSLELDVTTASFQSPSGA
jgi:hypothetical protein